MYDICRPTSASADEPSSRVAWQGPCPANAVIHNWRNLGDCLNPVIARALAAD